MHQELNYIKATPHTAIKLHNLGSILSPSGNVPFREVSGPSPFWVRNPGEVCACNRRASASITPTYQMQGTVI